MASRSKIRWVDTQRHIRRARELVSKYDCNAINPNEFMDPNTQQSDWDELLNRIK